MKFLIELNKICGLMSSRFSEWYLWFSTCKETCTKPAPSLQQELLEAQGGMPSLCAK